VGKAFNVSGSSRNGSAKLEGGDHAALSVNRKGLDAISKVSINPSVLWQDKFH